MKEKNTKHPNCFQCVHFYITHESDHPYGCRGIGFKSSRMPSIVVFTNSDMECQMFTIKKTG
ncbi:MAG: uracil-DNA glycosylase [Proteobacteria bacterium]|nr:uracil-DNA glycosylase [Pseudomonadota bacterium]